MKKITFAIPLLVCLALALLSPRAQAQFETPNRAFHNATSFRLEGKHLALACEACHLNNQYSGTPKTCYECHWVRRRDDRYQTRLGSQCEQCHRPTSWTAVRWDHAGQAGTPLSATHRQIACESCHRGASFARGTVSCIDCHQKDFAATTAPNHLAAGFPTACEGCHRPSDPTWRSGGGAGFSHNAVFALVGTHAVATCVSCHRGNVYKGTSRECVGCHLAQYQATTTPPHAAAGFATACESCHRASDTSWRNGGGGGFSHAAVFALVGAHASASCVSCHRDNVYRGTTRECAGCHLPQYNATKAPAHAAAGFSTACESCHRATDASWSGAGFNHAAVFALLGAHAAQTCATCHGNGVFRGTPRECVGCHQPQYSATRNPPHAAAGFSTGCESCHRASDSSWAGGAFNHNATFALLGRHASVSCASCHAGGVYKGTARTCVGCHQAQYNATRNPNHASSGFSTSCDTCHRATDSSWQQGRFAHRFPLSGPHDVSCSRCHTTSSYSTFSCTVCHTRSETDSEHRERAGYVYESLACYSCHPTGRH
jgi:hypothetical protein